MLNLYDQYGVLKATFEPDDSSQQVVVLQSGNELSLSFTMYECVVFEVNDYIDFEGTRFWAIEQYYPDQTSTVKWEYSVSLYGVESLVQRYLVLKLSNGEYEPIFSYTATAQGHMELIVAALNDGMGTTDWKVGEVVSTDYIVIDYNCTYGNTALSDLASEAGTEFWFENGMTINLTQAEHSEEITLAYGNGLLDLYREKADNVAFFSRFIPIGSSRNIVYDDYGYTRLQLPDKSKYVDIDVDKYGIIHYAETDAFSDIYPRYTGTVSSVRSEECYDDDGEIFYVYYITDDSLPFDPSDYIMDGLAINITFQSGDLNGRDFEVNYNSTTKEFEIINQYPYDDSTIQLPGSLLMEVGDTYIPWNLSMPSEYYPSAEAEYEEKVNEFIEENLKDIGIYKGTTDYVELEKRDVILTIGQRIRLESTKYFPSTGYRLSRITKLTRNVNHPKTIDIEVSDVLSTGAIDKINDDLTEVRNYTEQAVSELPDVIKSWESTLAADTNLYSAKKCVKEFISKTKEDTAAELITFLKGIIIGNNGSGFTKLTDGTTQAVVDRLYVKVKAIFEELEIKSTTHVGGELLVSPAAIKCTSVEEEEDGYKCFFVAEQDGVAIENDFTIGSLAMSKEMGIKSGSNQSNRYYWRKVIEVGDDYIVLSKSDCLDGSDIPMAEDDIVGVGHETDIDRQAAISISSTSEKSPSIIMYDNITEFSLIDKEAVAIYKDRTSGVTKVEIYGDFYAGDRDGESYIKYSSTNKAMEFKGTVMIFASGRNTTLDDAIESIETDIDYINSDSIFSIDEKLTTRTQWEQISARADVDHTPSEAGSTGSYMIAVTAAEAVGGTTETQTQTMPTIESVVKIDTGSSDDLYWSQDGNTYTSPTGLTNTNGYSYMRLTFNANIETEVSIAYEVSSESNYDYVVIGAVDQDPADSLWTYSVGTSGTTDDGVDYASGTLSGTITRTIPQGEHFIDIWYDKDSSASSGNDQAIVTISYAESYEVEFEVFTPTIDTNALTAAYQALLDLFALNRIVVTDNGYVIIDDGVVVVETSDALALYLDENTAFTRSDLSDALSAYYNAESAVKSATTEANAAEGAIAPVEYLMEATNNGALYASGGLALTNVFAVLGASAEEIATMTDAEKTEAIRAFVSGIEGDGLAFGAHSSDAYSVAKAYIEWYEGDQSGTEPTRPNFAVSDSGKVITNEMNAKNATITDANIDNATITNATVSGATIEDADITSGQIGDLSLSNGVLTGVAKSEAKLRYINIAGMVYNPTDVGAAAFVPLGTSGVHLCSSSGRVYLMDASARDGAVVDFIVPSGVTTVFSCINTIDDLTSDSKIVYRTRSLQSSITVTGAERLSAIYYNGVWYFLSSYA